jgi:hypothetical protein
VPVVVVCVSESVASVCPSVLVTVPLPSAVPVEPAVVVPVSELPSDPDVSVPVPPLVDVVVVPSLLESELAVVADVLAALLVPSALDGPAAAASPEASSLLHPSAIEPKQAVAAAVQIRILTPRCRRRVTLPIRMQCPTTGPAPDPQRGQNRYRRRSPVANRRDRSRGDTSVFGSNGLRQVVSTDRFC